MMPPKKTKTPRSAKLPRSFSINLNVGPKSLLATAVASFFLALYGLTTYADHIHAAMNTPAMIKAAELHKKFQQMDELTIAQQHNDLKTERFYLEAAMLRHELGQ